MKPRLKLPLMYFNKLENLVERTKVAIQYRNMQHSIVSQNSAAIHNIKNDLVSYAVAESFGDYHEIQVQH